MPISPQTRQLVNMLYSVAASLEARGENHWSRWLRGDAGRLRGGDFSGITHFLDAFGGMGSLNDLYICPTNGHHIAEAEVCDFNARLSSAISEAWSLAKAIQRGHDLDEPQDT